MKAWTYTRTHTRNASEVFSSSEPRLSCEFVRPRINKHCRGKITINMSRRMKHDAACARCESIIMIWEMWTNEIFVLAYLHIHPWANWNVKSLPEIGQHLEIPSQLDENPYSFTSNIRQKADFSVSRLQVALTTLRRATSRAWVVRVNWSEPSKDASGLLSCLESWFFFLQCAPFNLARKCIFRGGCKFERTFLAK